MILRFPLLKSADSCSGARLFDFYWKVYTAYNVLPYIKSQFEVVQKDV